MNSVVMWLAMLGMAALMAAAKIAGAAKRGGSEEALAPLKKRSSSKGLFR